MKKIKLFDPVIGKEEETKMISVLRSKFWASGAGTANVSKFENEFANYVDSQHCIAVNSGTAALHLALSLMDLKKKEVILPSLSFVSTAHSVIYSGGKPVFVDIDPTTLCIDFKKVEKAISKKTKLILPVHFGGMPSRLDKLSKLCRDFKIDLVEDAAHAAGAKFLGKPIGSHSQAVCFSFHPVKNLAMPTGGAITLNGKNSKRYEKILKSKRWCGISNRKGTKYDVSTIGWNYYMNEISAVIGLVQLKKLDRLNQRRKILARRYVEELNIENKMPFEPDCSYHLYWIQVNNREKFMKNMTKSNIETGIHHLPIHKFSFYNSEKILSVTENVGEKIVSIPIHPNLSDSDVSKIIRSVNDFAN